jgi:hypothetical protein
VPPQQQNQVQSPQQAQPSQSQSSPQQPSSQQGNNNISLNPSVQQSKKASDLLSKIVDLPFPPSSTATPSSSEKLTSTSNPQANSLSNEIRKFNINNNKKQGVRLSPIFTIFL